MKCEGFFGFFCCLCELYIFEFEVLFVQKGTFGLCDLFKRLNDV